MNESPMTFSRASRGATAAMSVAAAALLAGACGGAPRTGPQPAVPVTVGTVVQKTMPVSFRAIGHVEPISTVAVKARIGGELQKVWFSEGQTVHAGQTLFTIDPRQYEAALRQAEAQLAKDQALLVKANADVRRYGELVKKDYVTKSDFDQVTANAEALRATVASDQANIDNARLQVAYCTITSPVEGRTGNLNVKAGNLVKADDTTPLVTINQIRPIYASFSVPAQLLPSVLKKSAGPVKVTATIPESAVPEAMGTLSFVDNNIDEATGTVMLKATFPNEDEALWPGQFVNLTVILGEEPDRVVAPAPAVQTSQQGQYVYLVRSDDTVELRPVKVNRIDEINAVIDRGLSPGDRVVTDGQLRLVSGARIEVKGGEPSGVSHP